MRMAFGLSRVARAICELFAFDAFEQGSKITSAEALISLALNQLEEERTGAGLTVETC